MSKQQDVLIHGVSTIMAGEIEIAMICKAAKGILVRNSSMPDVQAVILYGVFCCSLYGAGVSLVSVGTGKAHGDGTGRYLFDFPDMSGKSLRPTVMMVAAVIKGQGIGLSI